MATDRTAGATVPLSVRAPLDTANPVTDRAPGTLTVAEDVHTRYWGPREGNKSLQSVHDMTTAIGSVPTTAHNPIIFTTANSEYAEGYLTSTEQWTLPRKFTLDIVFQPDDVATQANSDLQIFEWRFNGSYSPIIVNLKSDAAGGNSTKVEVILTSSDPAGTAAGSVTLTSTTQLSTGTGPEDRHWIRVTRDATTTPRFRLLVNGVQEDTANRGSTNNEFEAAPTDTPTWLWSNDTGAADTRFDGKIHLTLLRSGVFTDDSKAGFNNFLYPRARSVLFYVLNDRAVAGLKDYSRFGAHGAETAANIGTPDRDPPFMQPVQGMGVFEDVKGRTWNFAVVGGIAIWERAK